MNDIKSMTPEFHDALIEEGFTTETFMEAARIVTRRARFYPKLAEIIEVREEAFAAVDKKRLTYQKQVTHTIHKEQVSQDEADERISIIKQMVAGKLTMDESIEKQQAIVDKIISEGRDGEGYYPHFVKHIAGGTAHG